MQLKLKRSQRAGGIMGGKVLFGLDARAELSPDEQALIRKYNLGKLVVYALDRSKVYRFFALEADRNTLPVTRSDLQQSSYLRKILAYRQISVQGIHKSHLGLPNLLVLTVTTNERHMANIMSLLRELAHEGKSRLFLFKTMSSLGDFNKAPASTGNILTDPWQRVGYEAFRIDRP